MEEQKEVHVLRVIILGHNLAHFLCEMSFFFHPSLSFWNVVLCCLALTNKCLSRVLEAVDSASRELVQTGNRDTIKEP